MKRISIVLLIAGAFGVILLAGQRLKTDAVSSIRDGRRVSIDYTLSVEGKESLNYIHGQGQILPALERQLTGLVVGDEKTITLTSGEGYGEVDAEKFYKMPTSGLSKEMLSWMAIGNYMYVKRETGRFESGRIAQIDENFIMFDFNHPLAGKTLNFKVKIVSIE